MELDKLTRFNEWWTTKRVRENLLMQYKRPMFFNISKYMEDRQIILIYGLRRVGKTSLMYQLIQDLLDKGNNETTILYFSFDEQTTDFEELIKTYEEKILSKSISSKKLYFFLDEIQKVKDWEDKLKIYYDLYPNIKFVISGSASVQLEKNAKESLAGRILDFMLEPLSFEEFLSFKNVRIEKAKLEIMQKDIMPLFYDYLKKGGFPEIVNEDDSEKIKKYVKTSVIDKIIYQDLPSEFKIRDLELLKVLLEMIAFNPGMSVNFEKLSIDLKKNKNTILDYFYYLKYSLLVRLVANYREGFLVSSRKMKKAYLTNTAISFALCGEISDKLFEKIFENYAVIACDAKNYYRNKSEIDVIIKKEGKIIPIEVKYGEIDEKGIMNFLKEFSLGYGIILTREIFRERKSEDKLIRCVPLWVFAIYGDDYIDKK